jgi:Tfp pilus assembly protein PilV
MNKQKGIGIIEVMVAAVIFALGIIAIIQLQGNFFTSSSAAQAHSIAMNLAEEKVEDLRGFEAFDDTDGDIFDFIAIANNAGGQCDTTDNNACALTIPSGNVTVGNTTFTRTWEVTDYYYNAGVLTTTPNGNIAQKDITVTIAWVDADGSAQTATANAVINSNLVGSGGVLVNNAGGSGESPQVPYSPSNDPRVTPISVGTDSKRETLVPASETVDGYARTQFTAYTYNSSNILLRQEEFKNVACECRFNGTSSAGDETYAASYPAWDSIEGSYVDVTGDAVTGKVKGCVQGGGNNCDANPEPFCEICCRDHHDMTGVTRKYDPYRSNDDYEANGNHRHYDGTTVVTSGPYQESCRLKRVDGYWRVFQDWHMVNFDAVTLDDLNDSGIKDDYAAYVQDIIDQHLDESKVAGEVLTSPPSEPASTNHNVAANYVNMTVGTPTEVSGRALFLDYIDATHLTNVQTKKTANEDYLLHLPFYEVEVVEVANWVSADDATVEVGPIDNPGNNNDVPAGQMNALQNNANTVVVTADIRKSNSALTDLNVSVDYNAATNPDSETRSDSLTVCVGGTCTPSTDCTTPWGTTVTNTNSVTAWQAQAVVSPASCVSETRTCSAGTLSGSYQYSSCTVIPAGGDCTTPWSATVADGASVTAWLASVSASCTSETRTCSAGTLSGTYQYESCVAPTCNTTVSGKANNKNDTVSVSDGTTSYACTVANSKNYTCPTITTPTNATITVTSVGTVNASTVAPTCGAQIVNF